MADNRPNPPPEDSRLPDAILQLGIKLNTKDFLSHEDLRSIQLFRRAANYIAAGDMAMIVHALPSLT